MLEETRPDGLGRARGLVSNRASGARVEARTFAPSAALAAVVQTHWVSRWDFRDQPPHTAEIISDPCVNVVFERGGSRVVGVCTRLFRRELVGAGFIRAVKLRPGAARALFPDRSITELTDQVLPVDDCLQGAGDIEAEVLCAATDEEGLRQLDAWLTNVIDATGDPNVSLAVKIVERIAKDPSLTSMEQVAAASGLSPRPLQRLFRDYVGASPKWVVRRYRLQEAALRLERGDIDSLAALAAELGYSDHGHLTRDFKDATGKSPTQFRDAVWADLPARDGAP